MSANIQVYSDSGCTTELPIVDGHYTAQIGPTTGIDGTNGGNAVLELWAKNTGTMLVSNVVLTKTVDSASRGPFSLDNVTYNSTTITLGNMIINAVVPFYSKVIVSSGTAAASGIALDFTISGTHLDS